MRLALWPDGNAESFLADIQKYHDADAKIACFVAERVEGGLGGFLEASLRAYANGCDTGPVGYIEGWYVDADLRQQGIGGDLVRAAEQWAIAQGCTEMGSDCLIDNEVSLRAHLALGYNETERVICFCKKLST